MNVLSMEGIAVYFVLFFLRNESLYPIKHSPDTYRLLALEYNEYHRDFEF